MPLSERRSTPCAAPLLLLIPSSPRPTRPARCIPTPHTEIDVNETNIHPSLVARQAADVWTETKRLYGALRRRPDAPWRELDQALMMHERAVGRAPNAAEALRLATEARNFFTAAGDPSSAEAKTLAANANSRAAHSPYGQVAPTQVPSNTTGMAAGFNPLGLVMTLAGRGIRLTPGDNGTITVSPAGALDGTARQQITAHRQQILAVLTSMETI